MNILRKLTLKNLRLNKTRTLVTIIGIILSTALITAVAGVASSGQMSLFNIAVHHNGDYDLKLTGKFNDKTAEKLQNNRDVESVYKYGVVGTAEFESKSKYRPYLLVVGVSENAFENCYKCELESGRFPAKTNELLLTPDFVKNSVKKYKVGDTIKLEIGERWQKGKIDPDNIPTSSDKNGMYLIASENDVMKDEEFIGEFTKEYKIVGIRSDAAALEGSNMGGSVKIFTAADFSAAAQHSNYYDYNSLNLNFTDSAEHDYIRVTSEITGIDEKYVNGCITGFFEQNKDEEEAYGQLEKANFGTETFDINKEVLHYKGLALKETNSRILFGLSAVVIVIILISSIFIIRNSFAISITEKTKLYGMLSSTGATPRQIRHNVLFEAFILGLIGIPLGIGLGVGVTALLILMCNTLLAEMLNGYTLTFAVENYAILGSAILGILTIFLSTVIIALRASRISPIEAIRSNNEVKVGKKRYKTPKLISRLFGTGGAIAWKNLKRSRKKYRTTVISIVVSVAIFISVFSLVQSLVSYSRTYYQTVDFNLYVRCNATPELAERARSFDEVNKAVYRNDESSFAISVDRSRLADGIESKSTSLWSDEKDFKELFLSSDGKSVELTELDFLTLDDYSYRELLKLQGLDYNSIKDKGIICNSVTLMDKYGYSTGKTTKLLKSVDGLTIEGVRVLEDENGKTESETLKLEIGGELNEKKLGKIGSILGGTGVIVSPEWFEKHITNSKYKSENIQIPFLYIDSSDADKTEQALTQISDGLYIHNEEKQARMMNAFALVIQIFVYGFILVISLIGLTNIFNTITTNMRLRNKEFAMLRSVGMTDREFNRMIRLESLLYTTKSLVYGIPLGLIGGYIAYRVFEENNGQITYSFPWLAIVISIVAVMLVVWMIMRFSIGKVRKQNIIETIRNDNI